LAPSGQQVLVCDAKEIGYSASTLAILGKTNHPVALEQLEFKTSGLYRSNPWFLSTIIAAYRMLDKVHI
jgi:hypothetical protein